MSNGEIVAKLDRIIELLESAEHRSTPVYQITMDGPRIVSPSDLPGRNGPGGSPPVRA